MNTDHGNITPLQHIPFDTLRATLARVFERCGTSDQVAVVLTDNCASAERDGAHSHGVFRIPSNLSTLTSGWVDGRAARAGPGTRLSDSGCGQRLCPAGLPGGLWRLGGQGACQRHRTAERARSLLDTAQEHWLDYSLAQDAGTDVRWSTRLRTVDDPLRADSAVSTLASFVVEDGQPRPQRS